MTQQAYHEVVIFFTAGDEFGYGQIMNFQTETGAAARILVMNRYEAITPANRQNCCFRADAVRVITKGLMKRGTFADGTINQVGVSWVAERKNVGFDGHQ